MIIHGLTKETDTAGLHDVLEAVLGGATRMDITVSTAHEEIVEPNTEERLEPHAEAPEVTH